MSRINFYPTLNPNSLKCVVDGTTIIDNGILVFGNSNEAQSHSFGRALFAIDGVTNVFALPQFLTVTKDPSSNCDDIIPAVTKAIVGFLD